MKWRKIRSGIYIVVFSLLSLSSILSAASSQERAKASYEEGIDLNKQRRFDEAIEEFREAVTLSLETHRYHQALFMTSIAARKGPQAIQFYKGLMKEYPNNATVHYWLGRFYLEKGSLNDAVSAFAEATRLAPADEHAFISLGHVYLRLGKDKEALKAYLQANKLTPHVAIIHGGIGKIYFNRKEFAKAEKEYEEALKLDPSLTEAQYNLGLIYEKKGEFLKAIKQWQTLLEADPNESGARERLARLYFRGELYQDAAREYSMLSQVRPNSPEIFFALGESAIMLASSLTDPIDRNKIKDLAVQAFERTVQLDPRHVKARHYLERLNPQAPSIQEK